MGDRPTNNPPCPPWCTDAHPAGGVHRHEVGRANIGGETVNVVLLQTSANFPVSAAISGPLFVEIHPDDMDDMVRLLTLAGQNQVAALVQRAATILQKAGR